MVKKSSLGLVLLVSLMFTMLVSLSLVSAIGNFSLNSNSLLNRAENNTINFSISATNGNITEINVTITTSSSDPDVFDVNSDVNFNTTISTTGYNYTDRVVNVSQNTVTIINITN